MRAALKGSLAEFLRAGLPPCLVFGLHCVLSLGFDAYDKMPLLDIPMHLLGGIAIAFFFHSVIKSLDRRGIVRVGSRRAELVMVFGLVAFAAIAWELAEYMADTVFRFGVQSGIGDTMKDQLVGLIGGAVYIRWGGPAT